MHRDKLVIEKEIKRILTRRYLQIYGRGPTELWVKVNHKVATFYIYKTLTQLEHYLLTVPDGVEEVKRLRKIVHESIKNDLCIEIELACGVKVLGLSEEICITDDVIFGSFLLKDDLE